MFAFIADKTTSMLSVFGYCCTRQTGAALIVGLIVLTALTSLSLSGMRNVQVEERMAGNFRDHSLAFQGAEAALRDAEAYLQEADLPPFDGSVPGLIGRLSGPGSAAYWTRYDWVNASRQAGTTLARLKEQPRYVIEALPAIPAAGESPKFGPLQEPDFFRITARSTGGSGTAVVILQGTFNRGRRKVLYGNAKDDTPDTFDGDTGNEQPTFIPTGNFQGAFEPAVPSGARRYSPNGGAVYGRIGTMEATRAYGRGVGRRSWRQLR